MKTENPVKLVKESYSSEFLNLFDGAYDLQTSFCRRGYIFSAGVAGLLFLGLWNRPLLWCGLGCAAVLVHQFFRVRSMVGLLSVERRVSKKTMSQGEGLEVIYKCENLSAGSCPPFSLRDHTAHFNWTRKVLTVSRGLPAGHSVILRAVGCCEAAAGRKTFGPFSVQLQDELGLFTSDLTQWDPYEMEIHYGREALKGEVPVRKAKASPLLGDLENAKAGFGINLYGVREYHDGDPLSSICWKKSTITEDFMVKEFESEIARRVAFVLADQDSLHLGYGASHTWDVAKAFTLRMIRSYLKINSSVTLLSGGVQLKDLSGSQNFKVFERALVGRSVETLKENNKVEPSENFFDGVGFRRLSSDLDLYSFYLKAPCLIYYIAPYSSHHEEDLLRRLLFLQHQGFDPMVCFIDLSGSAQCVTKRFGDFNEIIVPPVYDQNAISLKFAKKGLPVLWVKAQSLLGQIEVSSHVS